MPRILIVTGEASGDLHGANLAAAIRSLRPDADILGVGGDKMKAAGVSLLQGIDHLDAIGMVGLGQLRAAVSKYLTVCRFLRSNRLDAVVLIDNPGLNLRLARAAKRLGHRVIYYIAPQIWAWNPGRIRLIRRDVDRMIVVLPFEEALYRRAGVPCDFVGHPLLDAVAPSYDSNELRKRFGHDGTGPLLGLLPGSRTQEVQSLLPTMLQAAAALKTDHAELNVVIAQASSIPDDLIEALTREVHRDVRIVHDQSSEVMAAADLLFVASGTATLQAAVIGTPMVILYRVPWFSAWLIRMLIRIDCIGLVNIVAGERIVTELLQSDANPVRLREEGLRLLADPQASTQMRARLRAVKDLLGRPGASHRAAAVVLAECRS